MPKRKSKHREDDSKSMEEQQGASTGADKFSYIGPATEKRKWIEHTCQRAVICGWIKG